MTAEDLYLLLFFVTMLWMVDAYRARQYRKQKHVYKQAYQLALVAIIDADRSLVRGVAVDEIRTDLREDHKELLLFVSSELGNKTQNNKKGSTANDHTGYHS